MAIIYFAPHLVFQVFFQQWEYQTSASPVPLEGKLRPTVKIPSQKSVRIKIIFISCAIWSSMFYFCRGIYGVYHSKNAHMVSCAFLVQLFLDACFLHTRKVFFRSLPCFDTLSKWLTSDMQFVPQLLNSHYASIMVQWGEIKRSMSHKVACPNITCLP